MKNILYISILLLLLSEYVNGQGKIQGTIYEKTNVPASFATVALLSAKDSAIVKGSISEENGSFSFDNVITGSYFVTITTMGFKKYFSENINILASDKETSIAPIYLKEDIKVLDEIVVKADVPAVEKQLGKLIINTNSIVFKTANNAIDILSRSPGIMVDKDGLISIKGAISPKLMIDGKVVSEVDIKTLVATDIEKIEIISNAGARYDAESKGVINIILKKDKTLGLNGNANLSYEFKRFNQYEGGVGLTYKTPKVAYFGRIGYFSYKLVNDFLLKRTTGAGIFEQNSSLLLTPHGYHFRAGADYYITSKQTLGFIARGFEHPYGTINEGLAIVSESIRKYNIATYSDIDRRNQGMSYNVNYKAFFDDARKKDLTIDFNYAGFKNSGDQILQSQTYLAENDIRKSLLQNVSRFSTNIKSVNADYSHSITDDSKFEIGTKNSWINTENGITIDTLNDNTLVRDSQKSNQFIYDESILAAYGVFTQKWGKSKIEAGLRFEKTTTKGNSITVSKINERSYQNFLPSMQYEYTINDDNSLTLTYASKITRPSFEALNPFTLFIDKYTYIEGNPNLLPEKVNSVEFAYSHKNSSYSLSYYRNTDIIVQLPQKLPDGNTYKYTMMNVDEGNTFAVDANLPISIKDWWKVQNYVQLAYEQYKSNYLTGSFDNKRFSYYLKTTSVFKLPKGITFDLSFYFQSPSIQSFYRTNSVYELSGGFQKSILNDRGGLTLTFSDIFYTYRSFNSVSYLNIDLEQTQRRNTQGVKLSFNYKFGSSTFKQRSKRNGSADEENRANN